MHNLLVIAAFALAAVTPFMSGGLSSPGDASEYSDDAADTAAQPSEERPDGD